MSNIFAISDQHLRHSRLYSFVDGHGQRTRPWAKDAEEADELMIDTFNRTVGKNDKTYFLGDVSIARSGLALLARMNGRKILIRGNHDIFRLKDYLPHFADIRGSHKINRLIMTHYPIHPDSIPRWCQANVHGHTHQNHVTRRGLLGWRQPDPRYFNLCIEAVGLAPLAIEEIEIRIAAQQRADLASNPLGRLFDGLRRKPLRDDQPAR